MEEDGDPAGDERQNNNLPATTHVKGNVGQHEPSLTRRASQSPKASQPVLRSDKYMDDLAMQKFDHDVSNSSEDIYREASKGVGDMSDPSSDDHFGVPEVNKLNHLSTNFSTGEVEGER